MGTELNSVPISLIDTHAHLDSGQFRGDVDGVVARALDHGVGTILTVGCDLPSSRDSINLASAYDNVWASVGIHPHDALTVNATAIAELRRLAAHPKVVAIGEIGLDFYRDRAPREAQRAAFRAQIQLARELGKPLIVHDRDAHDEILQILKEEHAADVGGVMHCFSGDLELAKQCVALGFFISFAGPLTYPANHGLRAVVAGLPTDVMVIETDCPYLAPQSWRGKRCEPAYVRSTAEELARIKGLTLDDVARITSLNAFRLFGIGAVDQSTRIAYVIRNSLYLNITNRCTNQCSFCAKFKDFTVKGHQLCLEHEPAINEIIAAIGDPARYDEVVFCGYGEPLLRLDLVREVASWLKQCGKRVRINTDGQANLVHGRNILPELHGLVDVVSVSLNAPDAVTYQALCQSAFGEAGYIAILEFLRQAKNYVPTVIATAVSVPGIDMAACRDVASSLGVEFRERIYNEVG